MLLTCSFGHLDYFDMLSCDFCYVAIVYEHAMLCLECFRCFIYLEMYLNKHHLDQSFRLQYDLLRSIFVNTVIFFFSLFLIHISGLV